MQRNDNEPEKKEIANQFSWKAQNSGPGMPSFFTPDILKNVQPIPESYEVLGDEAESSCCVIF